MIDYVKALKRPFQDSKKFLIGTLLGMIPLVNLTVIGYTLNSTGLTKEKVDRDNLPEWTDYVNLFMKGLGAVLIGIIMLLPAALILTELQMEDWFAESFTQLIPLFAKAVPLLLFGGLLAALAFYLIPFALLAWLKEDSFSAAFSWSNLKKTMTLDYLVNWLIVGYLGGLLSSLLGWVPFLGMGITMYVTGVFSYTVFAELYERGQLA